MHDRLAELQQECGSILGCPLLSIGSEVSTQDKVVRDTVDRIFDRKIKYFESAIRDAHAQGLIEAPDPEAKAKMLFACYHGTLAQARIQNDLELAPRILNKSRWMFWGARRAAVAHHEHLFFCQFYRRPVKYNDPNERNKTQ